MSRSMGAYAISLIKRTILKYEQGKIDEIIPTLKNFSTQERMGRASIINESAPSASANKARQARKASSQICPKCGEVAFFSERTGKYHCRFDSSCGWSGKLLPC